MKTKISLLALAFFFAPTFSLASTPIWETLTHDEHWTVANSPYVVSYLMIPSGITLDIDPGVIVKFDTSTVMNVSGILNAIGTQTDQIYFTSNKDDDIGGDTNLDGGATTPKEGDWDKIVITGTGVATIKNSVIRYGGFACCWTPMIRASVYNAGGKLTVENSTVGYSDGDGIQHNGGTTIITGDQFNDNKGSGISATGTGSLTFTDNTFSSTVGSSVSVDFAGGLTLSNINNSGTNGINLYGVMNSDETLSGDGLPYLISYLNVPSEKNLTIQPGAIIKFTGTGSVLSVSGYLKAEGTSDKKIYFTSINDDGIGGDTKGDGVTPSNPGDWDKIVINSGGNVNLKYSVVRFGGFACCWTPMIMASIYNAGGTLAVASSTVSFSYGNGIEHSGGITTVSGSVFNGSVASGISGRGSGSLSFERNYFSDNLGGAVGFDLSGGIRLSNFGNQANGLGMRGISINGTMASDQTLKKDTIPYIVSNLSVSINRILDILPGAVIKMNGTGSSISIAGTVNAIGTQTDKIYFTSIKDDILADTNGDGSASSGSPSDWDKIVVSSGGVLNMTRVVVRYGGWACCWTPMIMASVYNTGGTVTILYSTIAESGGNGIQHGSGTTSIINPPLKYLSHILSAAH